MQVRFSAPPFAPSAASALRRAGSSSRRSKSRRRRNTASLRPNPYPSETGIDRSLSSSFPKLLENFRSSHRLDLPANVSLIPVFGLMRASFLRLAYRLSVQAAEQRVGQQGPLMRWQLERLSFQNCVVHVGTIRQTRAKARQTCSYQNTSQPR